MNLEDMIRLEELRDGYDRLEIDRPFNQCKICQDCFPQLVNTSKNNYCISCWLEKRSLIEESTREW